MKKKTVAVVGIVLALVLLFPIPMRYKDGGSVKYQAILYSVTDVHRLAPGGGFEEGVIVEILGMQVYRHVYPQTVTFHGKLFDREDLSQESLQWLDWYNGLTEQEQLGISYVPADLNRLMGGAFREEPPQETE